MDAGVAERAASSTGACSATSGVSIPDRLTRELEDDHACASSRCRGCGSHSGARLDLAALGDACRERGVFFVVDAIQGLGPLTLDVSTTHVDILACGAQKWLLSPWGSGFVYVREQLDASSSSRTT